MKQSTKKWLPGLKTLAVLVLFVLLSQTMSQLFSSLAGSPPSTNVNDRQVILFSIFYCVLVVALSLVGTTLIDRRNLKEMGMKITVREIILSLAAMLILIVGFFIFVYLMKKTGSAIWRWNPFSPLAILGAVLIYIAVGINEEFFFRGYLFKSLSVYGKVAAYLGSILVFTLIHFLSQEFSILYLIMLILISFLYALLLDITGSIWPGVIIHTGYDLILALTGGSLEKGSLIRWLHLDSSMTLNDLTMLLSIGLILLIVILVYLLYKSELQLLSPDQ